MDKINPLKLIDIKICNSSPDHNIECGEYFSFDDRSDFDYDDTQSSLSIMLTFSNERMLRSEGIVPGIRRRVSVNILDITGGEIMRCEPVTVSIPRNEYIRCRIITIPFTYGDIAADHSFKILVRDECSKKRLGEKVFHMYDRAMLGRLPDEWYKAVEGGLMPEWSDVMHQCINSDSYSRNKVRFCLKGNFDHDPVSLPELEIRLYSPDGKVTSSFTKPETDSNDSEKLYVDHDLYTGYCEGGVHYAELLCMDYPVAGFVFSTLDYHRTGVWTGEFLKPMEEYSLESATARLRRNLNELQAKYIREADDFDCESHDESDDDVFSSDINDDESSSSSSFKSDDYFDELLDRFIADENKALDHDASEDCSEDDEAQEENDESYDSDSEPACDDVSAENDNSLITLDHLTGLKSVKDKLRIYEKVVRFNKMRADNGLPHISTPLHAMFLGSPGTGKTTVAKMMGMMLHRAGVLSKGHVVVRERATLLGQNYNSEAEKTLEAIEESRGGILFIDEAYQLFQPNDPRDPGKFVIETLLTSLADETKRDWMLILAGYPDEMKRMFDINPGFKSRIPESNIYTFDDLSGSELLEIAENYLSRNRYSLTDDAREALRKRLEADRAAGDRRNFGNARHVINMIQAEIVPAMAVRVMSENEPDSRLLTEITRADIPSPAVRITTGRPRIGYIL